MGSEMCIRDRAETGHLVVANGGIQTHPDTGREKLNLETMRSSIVFVDPNDGRLIAKHETPDTLQQLSLRHLAFDENGNCYFGGQHQDGGVTDAPMAGSISVSGRVQFWAELRSAALNNYVTSIAAVPGQSLVALSSARANSVLLVNTVTGKVIDTYSEFDVSGVVSNGASVITSSGEGSINQRMVNADGESVHQVSMWNPDVHWDNHMTLR